MTCPAQTEHRYLLSELLVGMVPVPAVLDRPVQGLCLDSRRALPGEVFLAAAGHHHHGLSHAREAVQRGVVAVLWEPTAATGAPPPEASVPYLAVPRLRERMGELAARFHGHPSRAMQVVGVTGTDGKTSVSQCLAGALDSDSRPCGVIGTLGSGRYGELGDPGLTTPDPVSLQAFLAAMGRCKLHQVVMEVSSHALDQARVAGVDFDVAILTNLGRDHLDYHGTVTAYGEAKARLFSWPGLKTAVLNLDDPFGRLLAERLKVPVLGYGLQASSDGPELVLATHPEFHAEGIRAHVMTPWGAGELESPWLGRFNLENLLAVLAALLSLDVSLTDALERLHHSPAVPGRMERFHGTRGPLVVVDYAHTHEALAQVLQALRAHCSGRLWCVFGCGGNRDSGKRPLMAAVAQRDADQVVVTSDNPRHEDPRAIIEAVCTGFTDLSRVHVEADREAAIRHAFGQAGREDVVLIAGKGHETWQIFGDECRPFSDRVLARRLVEGEA
ncbi:UDP-N-acetylmuramoyl-L-alanyl-D-glutamate--2,6-diaminopimelate ligase [Ectothiorhodospira lacustris]|uniref:UDP-N-acetylmuramoyl-L-alanyl-D-glutamate--2, 6-diaminopimelate ligase n=1 Tax=Ectothiorhodospira lacustris TaxID=2899127 RepID=UPI001EE919C2|nr:UDP-N-acetylmuramoyl-L-alanyl-D-glutamate--2,6-diaminopimelate ligase [Ectothiorhodospira lacustris]MCG5501415.1 UDP-N-acetylmuramoyl-L-alanyl-D-glutamate--2,6-diaminopimelate ligase [Ectothiorhodospira lacustris]MCG5510533.1 UDP-N-acetylmuramoyl-L-alanyl-D-glutamate--2,6-diaminopimelate ligase [Ectothiorhodospira lacustris]MCG5521225.1 UDP-N-acetylmuramoyl-L-alanyl-D-glutamate--2,6-diaminopimelate ligase [Ectothiorhodospira lacustris]